MNNIESNTSKDKSLKTKKLILAGIFAALTAVCSWININLFFTPVPINLALIGPYMAGLLLGSRYGLMSQVIYILLGAIGLPVFAGFTGGLEKLVGPTGGFIAGYAVCAVICGLQSKKLSSVSKAGGILGNVLLMLCGLACCYGLGLIWYMIVTKSSLWAGFLACILPFLPGDAVKIAAVALLVKKLPVRDLRN